MERFRGEKRKEKSSLDTINKKNDKKMEDETKCYFQYIGGDPDGADAC